MNDERDSVELMKEDEGKMIDEERRGVGEVR
jgi:hypothetical protein